MALPSSPPLVPETYDLPILPSSPPDGPVELTFELPTIESSRNLKRQFSDFGSLSSDPLFSEASSDAEYDASGNGSDRRQRKRLVKGPWWRLRRRSTESLRRTMASRERFKVADSGVWMGSDMSDDSVDSTFSDRQKFARLDVGDQSHLSTPRASQIVRQPPTAEDLAAKTIHHCLETGHEAIDLSVLGLTNLSNTTLKPLHQLIRQSHGALTHPPSEDEFTSLTPSVQLFLSGNKLASLPSELFRLTNITVLSLRNNNLDELPPSIGRLVNLKELNIAQNNIRWLPWEMLELINCRGDHRFISVRPNPLVSPLVDFHGPSPLPLPNRTAAEYNEHMGRWGETSGAFFQQMRRWYTEEGVPWSMRHELELRLKLARTRLNKYLSEASRSGVELKLCNEQLLYIASSAITYFEVDGSPCRSTLAAPRLSDEERFLASADPFVNRPTTPAPSSVTSLFETALRSVQAHYALIDLDENIQDLPASVASALRAAAKSGEYGNESCSACGRSFIVARAEWMEFWFHGFPAKDCLEPETVLPFLRRVCSWQCARPSELGAHRV